MPDDFTIFELPVEQTPDLDELVRSTMAWHFSPQTGSPYWVGRAGSFQFDPLKDVQTYADLTLFDTVTVAWDRIPADQLIPAGCRTGTDRFGVYESGGTTGAPKRIVDASSRRRNGQWVDIHLDLHGFPAGDGNWLHIGPTGPHIMARNVANTAALRGFLCYYIDLDPRWVKRCLAEGRQDVYEAYIDHLFNQVKDVLETQDIRAVSATPPLLEAIIARADLYDLMRDKVRGIIWGGTSIDSETLRLLEEEAFPEATICGIYGNTMMGMAPQRPRREGDLARCVFRPFYPYTVVEVVDPDDPGKAVAEDAEGQVKITALTRDLFVPPTLERDLVTRRASADGYPGVEVSGVRPRQVHGAAVVEGVY
jgi:hypothetical protein